MLGEKYVCQVIKLSLAIISFFPKNHKKCTLWKNHTWISIFFLPTKDKFLFQIQFPKNFLKHRYPQIPVSEIGALELRMESVNQRWWFGKCYCSSLYMDGLPWVTAYQRSDSSCILLLISIELHIGESVKPFWGRKIKTKGTPEFSMFLPSSAIKIPHCSLRTKGQRIGTHYSSHNANNLFTCCCFLQILVIDNC